MCAVSPSQPVIEGTAQYLQLNHLLMTYLLRLRSQTLKGFQLSEAILALMVLVVSSSPGGSSKQARHTIDSSPSFSLVSRDSERDRGMVRDAWDTIIGSRGDTFISDICALLKLLGGEPLPTQLSSRYGSGKGTGWWARFTPSTPHEEFLHQTECPQGLNKGGGGMGTPPGWSLFDQKKLMLSLHVTSLATAFLRRRSVGEGEGIFGSSSTHSREREGRVGSGAVMLAMDFDAIVIAFVKCAGLCCDKGDSGM
jgi:hypothetical protein